MIVLHSGALLDHYRQYRLLLWRFWADRPRMLFIGLNPSTANESQDDPTVRRLCGFAERWGYGGLYCCNVFSQITPHPRELRPPTAMHPADIHAIQMANELSELVICGWGDGIAIAKSGLSRADTITCYLSHPMCFGLTAKGNPKHPLYLSYDAQLEPYSNAAILQKGASHGPA